MASSSASKWTPVDGGALFEGPGMTNSVSGGTAAFYKVALREPHAGMRLDYGRVALGSYFVELIELVTEPDHPAPELYDLLGRAFGFLDAQPAALRALLHFEGELARLLGIQGQANVTPAVAIGRAYHRLPRARQALLKSLKTSA